MEWKWKGNLRFRVSMMSGRNQTRVSRKRFLISRLKQTWNNFSGDILLEGVSGISDIESFDCSSFFDFVKNYWRNQVFLDRWMGCTKLSKRAHKFMLYMLTAGKKALADGGITEEVMNEWYIYMKVFYDAIEALRISYKKMNLFCVQFATTNMGSAILAMDLGGMVPNYSICTACDVMLCGGSDAVIIPIGGFVACRALSRRNEDPTKASRPWDTNRDGFVMGEGAGVLLLEELEHAKKRGATIYAEFLGGSLTSDVDFLTKQQNSANVTETSCLGRTSMHARIDCCISLMIVVFPFVQSGKGTIVCIVKALAQSGVSREDVNYVNAYATSTQAGDMKEYQSIIRFCSAKILMQYGRTGWVHPNVNLENPVLPLILNSSNLFSPCKE
ncbi:hypothetical protein MKW94_030100 [Papaver nudicaule]|uniref:beta-ketoacyl-[acyl-carrier-protein] synthase I n=1 Tax=Papaver nudicaule TaxID=74823 RepID=A0AA41SQ31_PAPNU|nr:hypothetical protein [Papaver nudicaule]